MYSQLEVAQSAEKILHSCVHCGFCSATCPTYQLLGDELDSPRGRIYLIKQVLEGQPVTAKTQTHLDRCLTCRACETTCPSGVEYSHLLEIGRSLVNEKIDRPWSVKLQRRILCALLPYPQRFSFLLNMGRCFKAVFSVLFPAALKQAIPDLKGNPQWSGEKHQRKMLILNGCVQPSLSPQINAATSRVFARLGIELMNESLAQCCGAVNQHLDDLPGAEQFIKQNIDAWYPLIKSQAVEAIVITASGCGAMVKEYQYILRNDKEYREKARVVSRACKDISEIIQAQDLSSFELKAAKSISFHSPCTLQHAQKLNGVVEGILTRLGFKLNVIKDPHLCCGSAGTYSILQPVISQQLKQNKLLALEQDSPELIATANIGCLHHLASEANAELVHWIELLDKN